MSAEPSATSASTYVLGLTDVEVARCSVQPSRESDALHE